MERARTPSPPATATATALEEHGRRALRKWALEHGGGTAGLTVDALAERIGARAPGDLAAARAAARRLLGWSPA